MTAHDLDLLNPLTSRRAAEAVHRADVDVALGDAPAASDAVFTARAAEARRVIEQAWAYYSRD
ncbi:hypothetical protein ACEYYB_00995 [Paracoccus sp. p4-l81]|uniref:hypothetical protein n=1 Tax=Paracoccus sp. p4-l81 TaxID=3342806 RepID=UPI0035B8B8D4